MAHGGRPAAAGFEVVNRILIQDADSSVPIGVDERAPLAEAWRRWKQTLTGTVGGADHLIPSNVVLFELAGDTPLSVLTV